MAPSGLTLFFVADITLDYSSHVLRGQVTLLGDKVYVELDSFGGAALTVDAATRALCSAVRDGRCSVPTELRVAIDQGASVIPAI